MTHTPGPWIIKPGAALPQYDGTPLQITANNRYIAKVDAVAGRDYLKDQNSANARLIAAAPAMLEALKGCERVTKAWLADMKDYPLVNPEKAAATMELIRIQEAIRLAEGRGEL